MRNDIDWERLDRYVRGDGTPEELEELASWVASDPERETLAAAMQSIGRPATAGGHDWNVPAAWQRVRRRMPWYTRTTRQAGALVAAPAAHWWSRRPALLAAAALLTVVAGSTHIAVRGHRGPAPPMAVSAEPVREITTRRGQRAALDLADGSRVVLGAESRLRISASLDAVGRRAPRDLYLEGEGYFEVQHDSTRPFRVHTSTGVAEDLGTAFVVTAYPETNGMQVVVAAGEVALRQRPAFTGGAHGARDPRPLLTLGQGDLARLDTAGTATLTRNVNIAPYLARAQGRLVFDGTRLGDVAPVLARWYDLDIRMADSTIASRRLVASFGDEPAPQVLARIGLALGLAVDRHGRAVLFSRRGESRSPSRVQRS